MIRKIPYLDTFTAGIGQHLRTFGKYPPKVVVGRCGMTDAPAPPTDARPRPLRRRGDPPAARRLGVRGDLRVPRQGEPRLREGRHLVPHGVVAARGRRARRRAGHAASTPTTTEWPGRLLATIAIAVVIGGPLRALTGPRDLQRVHRRRVRDAVGRSCSAGGCCAIAFRQSRARPLRDPAATWSRGSPGFGTTIFAEMSALAVATGAINLGQGFPDTDGPAEVADAAIAAIRAGHNQYPPGAGHPRAARRDRRAPAALVRARRSTPTPRCSSPPARPRRSPPRCSRCATPATRS